MFFVKDSTGTGKNSIYYINISTIEKMINN